jgi:hypothetical protein
MKHKVMFIVGGAVAGIVVFAVIYAWAATVAPGPYYATPSWDQTFPAATRFIILSNFPGTVYQAVLDRETGLVWERSPSLDIISWKEARVECLNKGFTGRRGWRLPSVVELSSLIDPFTGPPPGLPPGHPFLGYPEDGFWWTATTDADDANFVWTVRFDGGTVNTVPKSFQFGTAWCVRGGMSADVH